MSRVALNWGGAPGGTNKFTENPVYRKKIVYRKWKIIAMRSVIVAAFHYQAAVAFLYYVAAAIGFSSPRHCAAVPPCHCSIHILRHDIAAIHQTTRHVLAVARVTLGHYGGWLKGTVGDLSNGKLLMVCFLSRDNRGVQCQVISTK
ncbi:hypothetical protein D0Y65_054678 [Glycine soja]|uniref:Uncharacterized protein n=1 Tax=Glycine soja TaxID=3848 RepID=A0A445F7V1_GLYSO|nr:hypothetical protein D0Y65_054678 [Glycine soja]